MQKSEAREILGVPKGASETEVKAAYRHLALLYHPDRCAAHLRAHAEEKFKQITQAQEALTGTNAGAYVANSDWRYASQHSSGTRGMRGSFLHPFAVAGLLALPAVAVCATTTAAFYRPAPKRVERIDPAHERKGLHPKVFLPLLVAPVVPLGVYRLSNSSPFTKMITFDQMAFHIPNGMQQQDLTKGNKRREVIIRFDTSPMMFRFIWGISLEILFV
ncbi:hypothetical protein CYMTET_5400 [Cymbomonas tetramitiformis]|uniref:J domain-containing protein n=1 Tax=Cymbomonas tetramitiformis TaxID=36881 RepID=A0AAE0GZ66_9CHLO|nr:hypothetical protein CYMTET_5400 [Cymbomonas tetramitiformis]